MNPDQRLAAISEAEQEFRRLDETASQRRIQATFEEHRHRTIQFHFEARRRALAEQDATARPDHPPSIIPYRPTTACLKYPTYDNGYAYEERARIISNLLCTFIWSLSINAPDPIFGSVTTRIHADRYQTMPHSPQEIFMTVHGALVHIETLPYIWIIAEAHDFDVGAKYFRCWRNRQAVISLHRADGSFRTAVTWRDISMKLMLEPLYSRCHASPCELGWGQQQLQAARMTVRNESRK